MCKKQQAEFDFDTPPKQEYEVFLKKFPNNMSSWASSYSIDWSTPSIPLLNIQRAIRATRRYYSASSAWYE